MMLTVGLGEVISCGVLGMILYTALNKYKGVLFKPSYIIKYSKACGSSACVIRKTHSQNALRAYCGQTSEALLTYDTKNIREISFFASHGYFLSLIFTFPVCAAPINFLRKVLLLSSDVSDKCVSACFCHIFHFAHADCI